MEAPLWITPNGVEQVRGGADPQRKSVNARFGLALLTNSSINEWPLRQNFRLLLVIALLGSSGSLWRVLAGNVVSETFSTDPLANGWETFGNANLFQWNATNQSLSVTWDSSQPNSGLYYPLGTIMTKADDFSLAFDLNLNTIGPGADSAKAATFEIAVGFVNSHEVKQASFHRGSGNQSPDLVEMDYFWDSGFGPTLWPAIVSTNGVFNYNGASDYSVSGLSLGAWYHLAMSYTASNLTLVTTVTNLATMSGVRIVQTVTTNFTDFRVDALSITSYSDAGQATPFAGSVLAQGTIDNVTAEVPLSPIQNLSGTYLHGRWNLQFTAQAKWIYALERSTDLRAWEVVSTSTGVAGSMAFSDTNSPPKAALYRIRADRPQDFTTTRPPL